MTMPSLKKLHGSTLLWVYHIVGAIGVRCLVDQVAIRSKDLVTPIPDFQNLLVELLLGSSGSSTQVALEQFTAKSGAP